MSDNGKRLYDAMMNLSAEIGEIEVENRELKEQIEGLERKIKDLSCIRNDLVARNKEINAELIDYETADFWERLKYLFTGRL